MSSSRCSSYRLFATRAFSLLGILCVANISVREALAENAQPSVAQAETAPAAAAKLRIPARFNVDYGSSSAGFDGMARLGGFIPLSQSFGQDVTFVEGDLLLDNGANLGWSLDLGYRAVNSEGDRIRGGHVGLDSRSTDESTFYQIAAGYESLGKNLDFRLNGYLPLGQSVNTIRDIDFDTGLQTSSGFQNNQLVLSAVRERQRLVQEEEALGGFDAQVAAPLTRWNGGELIGSVGGYLLTGEETSLGGEIKLSANFQSNFRAGLSLQHDGIFGTNLAFSVGASWPGPRFHTGEQREFQTEQEIPIRLRDSIQRRSTVAVQSRTTSERSFDETVQPLRNPEEEQDYRFVHVSLGQENAGDGTYEAPFGTLEEAIALINSDPDTYSDGNTVIYVDGEQAPGRPIPSFAIPQRVRVLSQGPQQLLAGMAFPGFPALPTRLPFSPENNFNLENSPPNANGVQVELPDSGDGVFPVIAGGETADLVTMSDRTVLAGFDLQNATRHGVFASNVNDVELRNNRITNSGSNGIFLDNVGGSVTLFDNEVTGSGDRGLFARNTTTESSLDITIAGYELANNRVGMEFATIASGIAPQVPSQIITIGPSHPANTSVNTPGGTLLTNSILNSTAEGILVTASGDMLLSSSSQEFSFDQGTIDGSGEVGLLFSADVGAHVQELNVTNANITNNGGAGIDILNGTPPAGPTQTASSQELVVRDSTISRNQGAGININLADAGAQELVIRGNRITNNAGDGIASLAQNVSIQEWRNDATTGDIGASENIITGNGGQGIKIEAQDLAVLPVVGIANNQVSGNTVAPGIEIATTSTPTNPGGPTACLILTGNQIDSDIQLTGLSTALSGGLPSFRVQDIANVVANNNGAVVTFSSNLLGALTTPDATPFENETGNCID